MDLVDKVGTKTLAWIKSRLGLNFFGFWHKVTNKAHCHQLYDQFSLHG